VKRWVLAIVIVWLCFPAPGEAQSGCMAVYPETDKVCWLWEPQGGGIMSLRVIFDLSGFSITDAAFRVVTGGGFTGVYMGETVFGDLWLGNTQDGLEVVLYQCHNSPLLLATVYYSTDGMSPSCAWLEVVGHPLYDNAIVVADCGSGMHEIHSCCRLTVIRSWDDRRTCGLVPVEESTWGRVKALYRQ